MRPIAVFYHCLLRSEHRPIDIDYAIGLITAQMHALRRSGLEDAASTICVGVNGALDDAIAVASISPDKAAVVHHGKNATTEIPTLNILRSFAAEHPGYSILYHHSKGVSTPNQADGWRRRMEDVNVWGWNNCVTILEAGYDVCGAHWLTPEQNPGVIASPFFGGTFWWARSEYINTLPPLPEAVWNNRYEAETWIGKGPTRPRVMDLYPGWPTPN